MVSRKRIIHFLQICYLSMMLTIKIKKDNTIDALKNENM